MLFHLVSKYYTFKIRQMPMIYKFGGIFVDPLLRSHLPFTRISPMIPLVFHQDFSYYSICLPLGFLLGFDLSCTTISPRIPFVFH